MKETIAVGVIILFGSAFVLLILGGILHHRLLNLLRKDHHDVWVKLGSPTLFMNNSIRNGLLVNAFLRKMEYLSLDDEKLTRVCKTEKRLIRLYAATWCVLALFFILIIANSPVSD